MGIRLIAIDMDGTLLDDEKRIPEENMRALLACMERGIEIVPATGRVLPGLREVVRTIPGLRYAITINGAEVFDLQTGELLSSTLIPADLAVEVIEMAIHSGYDLMYDAYAERRGLTTPENYAQIDRFVTAPGLARVIRSTRGPVPDVIAHIRQHAEMVEKVNLYFMNMDDREAMWQRLSRIPEIVLCSSVSNNIEINAAGVNKGRAVLELAAHLGIAPEETMAIGDGGNDLTMIRMAGFGVAMENAEPDVLAAADYVTGNNNRAGVAEAIRRFALGKEGPSEKV